MPKDDKRTLMPKLRFPEFRKDGAWEPTPLSDLTDRIVEKVGETALTPVSITAGRGYVSQAEKFGRDISGSQYKNYIYLRRGDFAYNKGNSNLYPQGCVYQLKEFDEAAASNAFICFRLKGGNAPGFFEGLFEKNAHGHQLIRFLTSGARSDGLLNIKPDEFFSVQFPIPPRSAEQQKIADCLTSLDELIAAQGRKVEALTSHKKGLMQQLFPREGETLPRLRFPEFRDAPEWTPTTLGDVAAISSGTTPARANPEYFEGGDIAWVKTTDLNNSVITHTEECITAKAGARINPVGSVLVAMYGGFKQIGRTGILGIPAATNQAMSVLVIDRAQALPVYVLTWLNAKVDDWKRIASSSRKDPNVTGSDVAGFPIHIPAKPEQRRIADCLSTLDARIAAENEKLAALKTHKQGLMQQLFPSPEGD